MLTFIHVPIIFHKFWKNIFISKDASLGNFQFIRISLHGLLKLLYSSKDGINLKGKTPSFWLFVIFFQHIDLLSSQILPLFNRLFDPLCFRYSLSQQFQKCWLSTTNISLNCKAKIIWFCFRVDEVLRKKLILISREHSIFLL